MQWCRCELFRTARYLTLHRPFFAAEALHWKVHGKYSPWYVCQHGDDKIRSQLVDQLGRPDVLRADRHAGEGSDDDAKRGTGTDRVHLLRQDGHADTERDDV